MTKLTAEQVDLVTNLVTDFRLLNNELALVIKREGQSNCLIAIFAKNVLESQKKLGAEICLPYDTLENLICNHSEVEA